ncbi:ABC transporter ATP-binding protein [Paenibacillus nasutitermitis]|uniref:ABC transporter ATP-binding protein n=1 Tax=Paenibacillus nasutitermitis TaxID=1652958 RepID=A0A916YIH4_9BACL|nr:ABC transporter ATP-binding protein [Paenibacillus nasutitermitis]GGD46817.1 ABC transporter ATP-binding protein [Paenibacillus nasutitermitis]
MSGRDAILEVSRLNVQIQTDRGVVHAVQEASFQIGAGKILGIVGESGCGKSMTCMAVLGMLPAAAAITQGSIKLRGKELAGLADSQLRHIRGKELALVMQNPMTAFNPALTIGKQFTETLRTHQGLSRKQAEQKAIDGIGEMGLSDAGKILKQYPFELSGGMLQRIMIALSLSMKPSLLIADEPTTALDSVNRRKVMDAFRAIKEEGHTAILLVSHDLSIIGALADEVVVMKQGQILEKADAVQLMSRPQHEYTKMLLNARLTADSRKE